MTIVGILAGSEVAPKANMLKVWFPAHGAIRLSEVGPIWSNLGHLGHALEGGIGTLASSCPSLIPGHLELNRLPSSRDLTVMYFVTTAQRGPNDHEMKLLNS
jgi:hypothetical protein